MTGEPGYPSDFEGWGLICLERTLHFKGDARNLLGLGHPPSPQRADAQGDQAR